MDEDIPLPFDLPAVARKKVSAAFDENGVDFIFGLPGNAVLDRAIDETARHSHPPRTRPEALPAGLR